MRLYNSNGLVVVERTRQERETSPESICLDELDFVLIPYLHDEPNVRLISLKHNRIASCGLEASVLSRPGLSQPALSPGCMGFPCSTLVSLDLTGNMLESLDGLKAMPNIRVLKVGMNQLRSLEGIEALWSLDMLDAHSNRLEEVGSLQGLAHLRIANLGGNRIRQLPDLTALGCLVELNLRRNAISALNDGHDKTLLPPKLIRLFLSQNRLAAPEHLSTIRQQTSLHELSVEGNPFCKGMPLAACRAAVLSQAPASLRILDASECFIEGTGSAAASSSAPAGPASSSACSSSQSAVPVRGAASSSSASDHPHFLKQLGIPAIFSDPSAPGSSGRGTSSSSGDNEDWKALFQQQLQLMRLQLQASELENAEQRDPSQAQTQQQQRQDPPPTQQQRRGEKGPGPAPAQSEGMRPARTNAAPCPPLETTFCLPMHTAAAGAEVGASGGEATAEALCHKTKAARLDSLLMSTKELMAVEAGGAWVEVSMPHGPHGSGGKGEGAGGNARPADGKGEGAGGNARPAEGKPDPRHRGTRIITAADAEHVHLTAADQEAVLASRAEEFERAWTAVMARLIVEGQLGSRPGRL